MDARDAASLRAPGAIVAVLAGGRGERIGGAKPMRELAGRPLIDYPLAAALEPVILLEAEGRAQPLPARCSTVHAPLLREGLAAQASLRETFQSLAPALVGEREFAYFGDPRRLCFSVNSAEDLATAERWLSPT